MGALASPPRVTRWYTMQELCEITGCTRWMIRYYRQQGLLPPATGTSTSPYWPAVWTNQHLAILRAIRHNLEGNVTLEDIRDRLYPDQEES